MAISNKLMNKFKNCLDYVFCSCIIEQIIRIEFKKTKYNHK